MLRVVSPWMAPPKSAKWPLLTTQPINSHHKRQACKSRHHGFGCRRQTHRYEQSHPFKKISFKFFNDIWQSRLGTEPIIGMLALCSNILA